MVAPSEKPTRKKVSKKSIPKFRTNQFICRPGTINDRTFHHQKNDYSNWFNFDYKPLFDQNGQIIPLIIEQTKNGQTEKLVISGANVTGGQSTQKVRKKRIEKLLIGTFLTLPTNLKLPINPKQNIKQFSKNDFLLDHNPSI